MDHFVGSGEVEGELSSVAGEEIVDEIPGCDGGHSQEDEGSLAEAESTSDTLAYEGGIGQKYVEKQKRKAPKWLDHYVYGAILHKRANQRKVSCLLRLLWAALQVATQKRKLGVSLVCHGCNVF